MALAASARARSRQDLLRLKDHGAVDHLSVERDRSPFGRVGGVEDAFRPRNLVGTGTEALVDRCELLRMDAEFGSETKTTSSLRVFPQLLRIVERNRDAIDRRLQSGQARCQHDVRTKV